MKAHCASSLESKCVFNALIATFQLTGDSWEEVDSFDEADIVFVISDRALLNRLYREDKVFAYFEHRNTAVLPDNVVPIAMDLVGNFEVIKKMTELVESLRKKVLEQPVVVKQTFQVPTDLVVTEHSYHVLVIDDSQENLEIAITLLGDKHQVITALGFEEGMKTLYQGSFDVVLSDMQMPDNKHYSSFNMDHAKIGGTNAWGFFSMLEVTARGLPLALVTDGNHHTDWVSAGFDHIESANVNGQKVLFFNNIGKRWDKALKMLLEP